MMDRLTLKAPTPQNGQTHSNDSSFYKQHIYKKRQAEIGKKKITQMLSTTMRLNFCYLKLFLFFIHVIIQKL